MMILYKIFYGKAKFADIYADLYTEIYGSESKETFNTTEPLICAPTCCNAYFDNFLLMSLCSAVQFSKDFPISPQTLIVVCQ